MIVTSYLLVSIYNNITCSGSLQVRRNLRTKNKLSFSLHLLPPPPPFLFFYADVEQMAIDWLTGNFYFVDDVDDRIFVCDKDGQTCVTLLDQELYNPKGIALDPTMGSV